MADENLSKEPLTREVATIERDPFTVTYGGTMRPNDETLLKRGGGKGLDIYDDLERDGHVYAVIQKRKMAVIAREWELELPKNPTAEDERAAELVREQLLGFNFDKMCLDLLDAILKGFAVGEVMWAPADDQVVVSKVLPRAQKRFTFTTKNELRLLTREQFLDGVTLPPRKFVVHQFGAKDGNPFGLGLGHKLYWLVFFKRQDITFWLTFVDKFASPTVVGKYPSSATADERRKLLNATQAVAHETGVIIPEGMVLDLMEAARSGSIDAYEKLCRYMDEQISETVLGETLTTNNGTGGSQAATETHNDVREELTKADADLLSETLNDTLIPWIVELNVPGARPPRVYRVFEEDRMAAEERRKKRADADKVISELGYEPTPEYIAETYGPGWVKRAAKPAPAPSVAFAEAGAELEAHQAFAAQAGAAASAAMAAIVAPIKKLVHEAGSLEEIRDGLLEAYPHMNATDFSELMQQALTASVLAGRFEVLDGR
jgi:phage gp29-like protein